MTIFLTFIAGLMGIILLLFFDYDFMVLVVVHRLDFLNPVMLFLTDFGMLFGVFLFSIALFKTHRWKWLVLVALALIFSLELSYLVKLFFEIPRPYETWPLIALKTAQGFSFPSMHAAFIFSALPFFKAASRPFRWTWGLFALVIAFSRVYVGVHYVSDVVAGALLGYSVGLLLLDLERRFDLTQWVLQKLRHEFEVRRQLGHAVIGVVIIFLFQLDILSPSLLLMILVSGGLLSVISTFYRIPGLQALLDLFERDQNRSILPGRGAFFMVLGALLASALFPKNIAMAAIAIMAMGDSVTNIFGRYFGEVKLPYNSKKTIDGVLIGIGAATLGALYFVPLTMALLASSVAMFVESWDLKIGFIELDDNILVPLVAGGVMLLAIA